ncbi:hypothetical protein SYNPS1DRAFT_28110 [Syncephalis pseudoplumigaleata]|uniref:FAS1 domain-containing protein n=1 Tax=Syncephalis pseudoplumigaleata TaxID=1712513 RepID=A0A4P9Z1I6_9FUNG|nr:hypothetical protein SYNPS1DRAFT_28110 [Syncephalis pseudoplumigaleata]|eukprot:RKP26185.1 hypothetical protein SYNPS1DRAFT_28110 [Syncephalis pseudoplumigaleata]
MRFDPLWMKVVAMLAVVAGHIDVDALPADPAATLSVKGASSRQTSAVVKAIGEELGASSFHAYLKKHYDDGRLRSILGNGPATVFVPNNDAARVFPWPAKRSDDPADVDMEIDIVRKHIVVGHQIDYRRMGSNEARPYRASTVDQYSAQLVVRNGKGGPSVNCARILGRPHQVEHTFIYLIDAVLPLSNGDFGINSTFDQCNPQLPNA